MDPVSALRVITDVGSELSGISSAARLGKRYMPKSYRSKLKSYAHRVKRPKMGKGSYRERTKQIGADLHVDNAKRYEVTNTTLNSVNGSTLYIQELTNIPQTANNTNANERQRHTINMRGAKLCFEVNNTSAVQAPLYFHVAVVGLKGKSSGVSNAGFFRGNGAIRNVDADSTLSALQWNCLPINSDDYTVLHHDKMVIGTAESSGSGSFKDPLRPSYLNYNKWVSINRQIRYDGASSTDAQHPIYVVYWFDRFGRSGSASATTNIAQVSEHHITYFKETTTCC